MSHKNAALAFGKNNSCPQDVQKWMPSSNVKIKSFESNAQLKKLDSYLTVRIHGSFIHPANAVKNLSVWFDANFSFPDHACNICKTCLVYISGHRQVRQYFTDEDVILVANALISSHLDYCNFLFRSLSSLTCTNLLILLQTVDTHGHFLFSKDFSRIPLHLQNVTLVIYFITMVIPAILVSSLLSIHCGILNSIHLSTNRNPLRSEFCFWMFPQFGLELSSIAPVCILQELLTSHIYLFMFKNCTVLSKEDLCVFNSSILGTVFYIQNICF